MEWIAKIAPFVLTVVVNFLINSGYNKRRFEEIEKKQEEIEELDIAVVFEKLSSSAEDLEARIKKFEELDIAVKLQGIGSDIRTLGERLADLKEAEKKHTETIDIQTKLLEQMKTNMELLMENFKLTPKV